MRFFGERTSSEVVMTSSEAEWLLVFNSWSIFGVVFGSGEDWAEARRLSGEDRREFCFLGRREFRRVIISEIKGNSFSLFS